MIFKQCNIFLIPNNKKDNKKKHLNQTDTTKANFIIGKSINEIWFYSTDKNSDNLHKRLESGKKRLNYRVLEKDFKAKLIINVKLFINI